MNGFVRLLTSPLRGWGHCLRLLRDPHARWVAGGFFILISIILGLGYMYTANSGFGFLSRGCGANFGQGRLAALLMLTPIAFALALSSIGEAIRWMDTKRRGHSYNLRFFWKLVGLGGVLLVTVFLLGRC